MRIPLLAVLAAAGAAALSSDAASAAPTYVVNSLADTAIGDCSTPAGTCTLRDAVAAANGQPESTIRFAWGLGGTIALHAPLAISSDVSIEGPGARRLTLDATGADALDIA